MISINRLPEPDILRQKKEQWLKAYLEKRQNKPGSRPNHHQYGHPKIRETLEAMSAHKCFYCERKLVETKGEVDHYTEVAEDPLLAFEWQNLYLSCPGCNHKLPYTTIPTPECLDPCNSAEDPAAHLTFDREVIRPKAGSVKGSQTIRKYKLDRQDLNYLRLRRLQDLRDLLDKLKDRRIRDGGRPLTQAEKEALVSFKEPHHAFSLMFSVYLSDLEL